MTSFIARSACRGRRPSAYSSYNGRQRFALMGRLLRERNVVRFIVAPDGYGKTCLTIDYAETVFSWVHVFFMNGQSPCFVRDLDEGHLADLIFGYDSNVRLVIFDDLSSIDSDRADKLSKAIDALLAHNCEVIVTCTPMCDVFSQLQQDRMCINARELLLSDEELDAVRTSDERMRVPSRQLPPAARVPALVWGDGDNAYDAFTRQAFKEQLPADYLLAIAGMMVLRKGRVGALSTFCSIGSGEIADIFESYPHLGYELDTEVFETPALPIASMTPHLKRCSSLLVSSSSFDTWGALVQNWADTLLETGGDADRACEVISSLCSRGDRPRWILEHASDLVRAGCFYSTLKLIQSIGAAGVKDRAGKAQIASLEAVCRSVLGDAQGACTCANRFAFDSSVSLGVRICCQLVLARYGLKTQRERGASCLGKTVSEIAESELGGLTFWEQLALAWDASCRGVSALAELWIEMNAIGADTVLQSIVASWFFALGASESDVDQPLLEQVAHCDEIQGYVRDRLESASPKGFDYLDASAALAMERAHMRGMSYAGGSLATSLLIELRRVELAITAQRRKLEHDVEADRAKTNSWVETHPDAAKVSAGSFFRYEQRNVPVLSLKLFGGFSVSIGGEPLPPEMFHRQHVRSLLVLLAINQGREISRDAIARAMWPNANEGVARKNFYSIWSLLKKALSLPDGTCPYLIRHQYGCSLESRHVRSDIARFNEICRELQFGNPDYQEIAEIYAEIEKDFSCDLMPAEPNNELIVNARNEYRARLVDSLVSASIRVVDGGNPLWGIWFARAAIDRERTREDAYIALMRAQIAAEQRTAAIMTYHQCRRVLAEELGVDPSPEMQELYQSLIDADEPK